MDEQYSMWVMGVAALTATISYAVRHWLHPPLPPFIMGEWTGPQLLEDLGSLDRNHVASLFVRDMQRRGEDPADMLRRLPPPSAYHHVPVQALCTQLGLAFMYTWLVQQFAPFGFIPCHDSYTHALEITDETIRHTLHYRLQSPHATSDDNAPSEVWKVDLQVRFCPRRQALRHAKVLAVPQRVRDISTRIV